MPSLGDSSPSFGETPPSLGRTLPSFGNTFPSLGDTSPSVGETSPRLGDTIPRLGELRPKLVDGRATLVMRWMRVTEGTPKLPPVAPYVGTDRLGRALTNDERKELEKLLRAHDFSAARRRAILFGRRLTRSLGAAEDLVGRACLRLVRWGWDPNTVSLEKRLCRLVWSEWTHEKSEDATRRKAEAGFLAEMAVHEGTSSRSPEDYALRLQEESEEEEHAKARVDQLRQEFVKRKDNVNLYWLEQTLAGNTDLGQMARDSGRTVEEFAAARKRRHRIVADLVAEQNGVKHDPGEKPR
ncbi:MAG TPA: hypothetical protein VF765_29420 [Polyangiaceae bacterium]